MFSVKRSEFEKLNDFPINTFSKYRDKIYLRNITDLFRVEFLCLIGTELQSYYYDADYISDHVLIRCHLLWRAYLENEYKLNIW